ncbi:cytochrome c maturation protein CcmE [Niveispirillum sp.]|uniref:cytochrome c maturation protein CcmE n=1 Tax=Niveispirillum sp. TaxID=1917217 RepID=UPI001B3D9DDB|nr:cytochrome c maturation protein CcmE [Niveispirillum sp.]MBP7334673.1 cytochrome c maturation protein CcmE [Niveispirillum sp.]
MTRKKRRLYMLLLALAGLGTATALTLTAFEENVAFFFSPSDLVTKPPGDKRVRVGGLVEGGSVVKVDDGVSTRFTITDTAHSVTITTDRPLPDLFREGQGVLVEGRLGADGVFVASEVLAKHDEKYMPKEVADALKASGQFKPELPGKPVYEAGK